MIALPQPPPGGFRTIYADPPWKFRTYSDKGMKKHAQQHYDCMTSAEIAALPVADLAAKDCLLWLWGTWPMLPMALDVMDAWGFEYRTGGSWFKRTKNWKEAFGTGYLFRSTCEPFLIGIRGKPPIMNRSVRNAIYSGVTVEAQLREHSRKPEQARAKLESMSPGPRVELFAREAAPGWVAWGDEVGVY